MKNPGTFFLKRDNFQMGLLLGIIVPLLVFLLIYFMRFSDEEPLGSFLQQFGSSNSLITFFGVWCMVANIALFTFYINTNRFQTAKGIFVVTLVYGVGILLLKLLN